MQAASPRSSSKDPSFVSGSVPLFQILAKNPKTDSRFQRLKVFSYDIHIDRFAFQLL